MFTIFQTLSGEIYRNLGVEIPPEKIEPAIQSGELKISGRMVDIGQYKRGLYSSFVRKT
jgi:hypothetical protein